MKFIIILAILGIAAGASSLNDVKKAFERFELHQASLRNEYYPKYKDRGLDTFADIVKQNTFTIDEITKKKKALYALPIDATVENNEQLAWIANQIADENDVYISITYDVKLSANLKFKALILATKNLENGDNPTPEELKKSVKALIEAEQPVFPTVKPDYKTLYVNTGSNYSPTRSRIQAKMEIIKSYYKRPEVGLSKQTIARIDKILADNKEADLVVGDNFPLDTVDRFEEMLKVLPAYLKTNADLFIELTSADIECSYVRCRSTKYDRKVTRDDIKKEFETFEIHQKSLRDTYYDAYKKRGLLTMSDIVKVNSLPVDEIAKEKDTLYALPATATTDNNDELARIANRIQALKLNFFTLIDSVTISDSLKFRSLILAVQNPDKTTFPTAADLKKGVTAAIKAENPISADVEKTYADMYAMNGERYYAPYSYIQARMDIIKEYYQQPEVGLPKEIIAKIDIILKDNSLASAEVRGNYPMNSIDRMTNVLGALPAYLKTYVDLLQTLNDAQYECNFVRCRSTKNDPPAGSTEMPTDKPTEKPTEKPGNSALNRTSGPVFAALCAAAMFIAFM